ncbi:hypothetical protein MUNTM_01510 [Mycobacterium sp. MUNTM1]
MAKRRVGFHRIYHQAEVIYCGRNPKTGQFRHCRPQAIVTGEWTSRRRRLLGFDPWVAYITNPLDDGAAPL